jgi:hypothetical protein
MRGIASVRLEIFMWSVKKLEAPGGFEPPVEILQNLALSLRRLIEGFQ